MGFVLGARCSTVHQGRPARASKSCLAGTSLRSARLSAQHQRRAGIITRAYLREYPDPEFIAEVKAAFPEKGIATVEEARVLFSEDGYAYLDVRPALEYEDVGRVVGSVNIPIVNSKRVYDPEQRKKVVVKEDNPSFVEAVRKRFPDPETRLLVGCSDGRTYSMAALEALDEAGYANLAGLKGGFYAWFSVFDNKLNRRRTGEYAEQYTHDGDSCGIHSSGAGFERVDKIEHWVPPQY